MDKKGWKVTAIICIIITTLIVVSNTINYFSYEKENAKLNECYFDFCADYPEAEYTDDICYCYDYDLLGDFVLADTKYMK